MSETHVPAADRERYMGPGSLPPQQALPPQKAIPPPGLLRRIAEHLRTQNWTAIGVEFCVVVFGVALALMLNDDRQRADREEGATHSLGMLMRDLDSDLARLMVVLETQQKRIDVIATLPGLLDAPMPDNKAIAGVLQAIVDNNKTLIARDNVYDVMEAEGQLSVLPDELQAMISQTYVYDFPSLANVSLKNDDSQGRVWDGCVATYWNIADETLIAKSADDIARFESCVASIGKYAEFILAQSGGAYRDNALRLQTALHERLDGQ